MFENPSGTNKSMGTFTVTLPVTAPSATRLLSGTMDLDVTVSVRTVY